MSAKTPEKLTCTNCGTENPGTNVNCQECGAPLPRPAAATPAAVPMSFATPGAAPAAGKAKKKPNWLLLGGIVGALADLLHGDCYFLLFAPSSSVQATVSDVYWQTSVPLQEIRAVDYNNERGNPPSDAYNVSCQTESRGSLRRKNHRPRRRLRRSGAGLSHRERAILRLHRGRMDHHPDLYAGRARQFPGLRAAQPHQRPAPGERKRRVLTVFFNTEDGQKSYTPDNVSEFQQFQPGSSWTLSLNALGGVVGVGR